MDYQEWRLFHEPALERLLHAFDAEQDAWDDYERQCVFAVEARSRGLNAPDPMPPSPEASVFSCLRMCAVMAAARRAEIVRELSARRRPRPSATATMPEIVMWIIGEAMAGGIGCDFDTAYQSWFVFADLLLRDADIGAIVARVHPGRLERAASAGAATQKIQNAALARQERKRVNAKRSSFGYSSI